MRRTLRQLAVLVVLFNAGTALAWNGIGHQAVAIIAEEHLTPEAKAGIRAMLGEAAISDAEVCGWADQVKRERRETAPWHYVNIPIDSSGFDGARDGKDGNNIIEAIEKQRKILADRSATKEQRAE